MQSDEGIERPDRACADSGPASLTPDLVECLRKQGKHDIADEIERLRARVAELEAAALLRHGTFANPAEPQIFGIIHDVPPNTPR